ncbi:hypothetical protein [Chryseobacterium sp. T1]
MKNNDTLTIKTMKPKKETIDFLLSYSKNLKSMKLADDKIVLITKN